jgi:hypothetical protein
MHRLGTTMLLVALFVVDLAANASAKAKPDTGTRRRAIRR